MSWHPSSKLFPPIAAGLAALLFNVVATSPLAAATVTTSFESAQTAPFTVGTPPISVDLSAGVAKTVGQPQFYHTGNFSWHISPGETATGTFTTDASALSLWARTTSGSVVSQIRVFDANNVEIDSLTPGGSFVQLDVLRAQGQTLIGSFEVANTGNTGDVVVDDLSFTADVGTPPPVFDANNPIPAEISTGSVKIVLTDIVSGLTSPVFGTAAPGDAERLFIVDQDGQVVVIELATNAMMTFLDVASLLVPLGAFGPESFDERGLLGLAFHPDYASNGRLYTYTSEPVGGVADYSTIPMDEVPNHQSVVREFVTPDPSDPASMPDANTSRVLLRLDEPQFNHNAGALAFGSDDYLYIAVGDGGNADDEGVGHGQAGNGQDTSNPFGAILRIDPLGNNSANSQYSIPPLNPFAGQVGQAEEIFAYGFRNPFRMSFDMQTGDLYVADVGQNAIEEIDVVTLGNNYGWNLKEGSFFFMGNGANNDGSVTDVDPGVPGGLIDPLAEYDHDEGIAIIGGFVYRGSAVPELDGRYLFGDFGSFGADAAPLYYLDAGNTIREFDAGPLPAAILGFAQDANGEIYVLTNTTGTPFGTTGRVQRIDSPTMTGGLGGGGGGCFIATAAYGSYLEPEVMQLRQFRDRYLLTNTLGQRFVAWYYRTSPPIANMIAGNSWLKGATRAALTPLVYGLKYPAVTLFMLLGFAGIGYRRVIGVRHRS